MTIPLFPLSAPVTPSPFGRAPTPIRRPRSAYAWAYPHQITAMNPISNKRRRSSSPSGPSRARPTLRLSSPSPPHSSRSGRPPTASPSHPILPAPIPSSLSGPSSGTPFPSPFSSTAGPSGSGWQSNWPNSRSIRRSIDARSPLSVSTSPKMEGIDEDSVVLARDTSGRAPRSMIACTRCRRQKMKCDGPGQVPCRGCRQAGVPCVFEPRTRPKSISALPSRPGPFFTGNLIAPHATRPGTPTGPPFYPSTAAPAPPITSRPPSDYALRQTREPMPPPPSTSIGTLASAYRGPSPPTSGHSSTSILLPAPQIPYSSGPPLPPLSAPPAPPPTLGPTTANVEGRLRAVEIALQDLATLRSSVSSIQSTLSYLVRLQESSLQHVVSVTEEVADSYRIRAWPITPWLVGLRETRGLPSMVMDYMGKRTLVTVNQRMNKQDCDLAEELVLAEVSRLVVERLDLTRDEIRALGVYATWSNDTKLTSLTMSHARNQGLDRVLLTRASHDDWREWIYLAIMDQLCHIPDYIAPVTRESYAPSWRDRLGAPTVDDPEVRDRDYKLLAWLEYAEMLTQIFLAQQAIRVEDSDDAMSTSEPTDRHERPARPRSVASMRSTPVATTSVAHVVSGPLPGSTGEDGGSDERKALEIWHRFGRRLESWAESWSARVDPILALHLNYAILFTSSPAFLASQNVWIDLASHHEGYEQLERGRDAALAILHSICTPDISRTIPYSFSLYRSYLSLSILHLVSLTLALPSSPIVSNHNIFNVLRSTLETLNNSQPLDAKLRDTSSTLNRSIGTSTSTGSNPGAGLRLSGWLNDIVELGLERGGKSLLGLEPGRESWKRIIN
ncbi:hypothetical protein M231_01877 [Tremella mesenterica]|uniref:Zn(2)-C6 fungal-type domain-containing protein n=1 Tax=Tremella mesenterica TaxID=5217 RepID=A0A4Q1BSA6_TREME|nr:hypothetical protein M231_01877 [Tremella mesenterica]